MTATSWLTLDDLKDRTTLPQSEIERFIASGHFPEPVKQPDGTLAWRESEIEAWIVARPRVQRQGIPPSNRTESK